MPLMRLPAELQEIVFDIYVSSVYLPEACAAREVSKTFQQRIEYAMSKLPYHRFWGIQHSKVAPKWMMNFFNSRVPSGPGRPDARPTLNIFIDRVVDRLAHAEFISEEAEEQTARPIYKEEILRLLTLTSTERSAALVLEGPSQWDVLGDAWSPWKNRRKVLGYYEAQELREYANGSTLNTQDIFIAAAAVGTKATFEHFTSQVSDFNQYGKVFHTVWAALVWGDKNDRLVYLLSRLPPSPEKSYRDVRHLEEALINACSHGKIATGKTLIDFFSSRYILWNLTSTNYSWNIFLRCVQGDCVELLDHLLSKLAGIDDEKVFWCLVRGFPQACRKGRLRILRYMLEHERIFAYLNDMNNDREGWLQRRGLYEAARGCHIEAMKLLLDHGVVIDPSYSEYLSVLDSGVTGFRFATLKFLTAHGDVLDGRAIGKLAIFAEKLDKQARHRQIAADSAMALISATAAAKHAGITQKESSCSEDDLKRISDVIQGILDHGPELSHTSIDFVHLGKECIEWLYGLEWTLPWGFLTDEDFRAWDNYEYADFDYLDEYGHPDWYLPPPRPETETVEEEDEVPPWELWDEQEESVLDALWEVWEERERLELQAYEQERSELYVFY